MKTALLVAAGVILQTVFILAEKQKKYGLATILKGSASIVFILVGLFCGLAADADFTRFVLIGLICGAAGDVLLELRNVWPKIGSKIFLFGILVFMAGHVFYLIALLRVCVNPLTPVVIGAIAAALLLWWILSTVSAKPAFKIFGVFYIGAVVIMTAVACANAIAAPDLRNILFAAGALLFTASDVILIFNTFGKQETFALRVANLGLYYIGQILIALTILVY